MGFQALFWRFWPHNFRFIGARGLKIGTQTNFGVRFHNFLFSRSKYAQRWSPKAKNDQKSRKTPKMGHFSILIANNFRNIHFWDMLRTFLDSSMSWLYEKCHFRGVKVDFVSQNGPKMSQIGEKPSVTFVAENPCSRAIRKLSL